MNLLLWIFFVGYVVPMVLAICFFYLEDKLGTREAIEKRERKKKFQETEFSFTRTTLIFTPFFNILIAIHFAIEVKDHFLSETVKRERKEKAQYEALKIIKIAGKRYRNTLSKFAKKKIQNSEKLSRWFFLENNDKIYSLEEFASENLSNEKVKKILLDNELPFAYINSLYEQHRELVEDVEGETFQKIKAIVEKFFEKMELVKKEEEEKQKVVKKKEKEKSERLMQEQERFKLEEKRKKEIEMIKSKERINEELELILEVQNIKN